jgi:hypothetical protein
MQKQINWQKLNKINATLSEVAKEQKLFAKQMRQLQAAQQKTDEQIRLTNKEIDKLKVMVGDLTNSWGKFVEGLVAPSVPVIFKKLKIDIFSLSPRIKRYKDGKELEIDILCLGKDSDGKDLVILTEVKSDVSSKDIDSFLVDIERFKYFFDEYKGRGIIGVIAGMKFGKGVQRYAERCGLYILGPSGEVMELLNKSDFKPRVWD